MAALTLSFDIVLAIEASIGESPKAPVFHLFGGMPRIRPIKKKQNLRDEDYYTLTASIGYGKINANPVTAPE